MRKMYIERCPFFIIKHFRAENEIDEYKYGHKYPNILIYYHQDKIKRSSPYL